MNTVATYCALGAAMLAASVETASANPRGNNPRISSSLSMDSTIFTVQSISHKSLSAGETFTVRIHVAFRPGWRIFSSRMENDGGMMPLGLTIPPELSHYFYLVNYRETGDIVTRFDFNFQDTVKAHYTPFDIIAKVKVLRKAHGWLPFQMLVHYMTCDSNQCWPPRWFDVPMTILGQKPMKLHISENVEQNSGSYPYERYRRLA